MINGQHARILEDQFQEQMELSQFAERGLVRGTTMDRDT